MTAGWPPPTGQPLQTPPIVAQLLQDYGAQTRRACAPYLADTDAPFIQPMVADHFASWGKMLRPGICIATARAFGGTAADASLCAAAIELLHNAVLVHDDIEDDSEQRRGRATLNARYGVPLALNAGDAMLLMALRPLADALARLSPRIARAIVAQTLRMARETVEGQAFDLGWRDTNQGGVGESDYLEMVLKKTAWMAVIWPLQIGALIGSHGRADPETMVRFGFFLGAAFQIQDDLLNLVADARYGKEAMGDLYEGKRTLMLIHVARRCNAAERRRLSAFLSLDRRRRTPAMVAEVRALIETYGAVDYARSFASALAGAAQREFDRCLGHLPPSSDRTFLASLPTWVFERT